MTVAAPDTPGIAPVAVNRTSKLHYIRANIDDDNSNGVVDLAENFVIGGPNLGVNGENDLLYTEVNLNYSWQELANNNFRVVLQRNDAVLQIWGGKTKLNPLPFGNAGAIIGNANAHATGIGFYTEWAGPQANNAAAALRVRVQKFVNNAWIDCQGKEDIETFKPLRTDVVVIAFVGEGQSVNNANNGMSQITAKILAAGYDVHLFSDDDVGRDLWILGQNIESVIPLKNVDPILKPKPVDQWESLKAVKEAILTRNATKVAIVGYSHGAGATYMLSVEMAADPDLQAANYVVEYTASIDAVKKGSALAEMRLPVNSTYHYNLYQSAAGGYFEVFNLEAVIQGDFVAGAATNDNVDLPDFDPDGDFDYGFFNQGERHHTNRGGRGIAETAAIQDEVVSRLKTEIPLP